MDPIEAITEADPKASKKSAGTAAAAAWLKDPDAPEPESANSRYITQLELEPEFDSSAPICCNCGNLMQQSGSCHTCPTCGTSNGCA